MLHHLSVFSVSNAVLDTQQTKTDAQRAKKDFKLGPWDVCRQVFSASDHRSMSLQDRSDLFFADYSMGPLFVQENYLKAKPANLP